MNDDNDFVYDVISLKNHDTSEIINTINYKIENSIEISAKELILFALVPIIKKTGEVEDYVEFVTTTLLELKGLTSSIKALIFGIEWLIVDKFVKDKQTQVGSDKKTTQKQKQNKNKYNYGKNYWN